MYYKRSRVDRGLLLSACIACTALQTQALPFFDSPRKLEAKIHQLENELETLPFEQISPLPWTRGYQSQLFFSADHKIVIDITFAAPCDIDLIALAPRSFTPNGQSLTPAEFPRHFKIEGILDDTVVEQIADRLTIPFIPSGIEPQLFYSPAHKRLSGIRITATQLTRARTHMEERYRVSFDEIFAFSGQQNVALQADVQITPEDNAAEDGEPQRLVDGFSLYLPTSGHSRGPNAGDFRIQKNNIELKIDLGSTKEIDELRLWPVLHGRHMAYTQSDGLWFPQSIRLASVAPPETQQVQLEKKLTHLTPGSNPLMLRLPECRSRYLHLSLADGHNPANQPVSWLCLGEIELLSKGQVQPITLESLHEPLKKLPTLTDGITTSGDIIPLRDYLEMFVQRTRIQRRLADLRKKHEIARHQQVERLGFIVFASLALTILLILLVLLIRLHAQRRWKRLGDQIACNLHDELGANMSSVAHSAELIKLSMDHPTEEQSKLMQRTIAVARETARETRNLVQLLEMQDIDGDLTDRFREAARQILSDIPVSCTFEASEAFNRLSAIRRWDLLLFLKEALNNILKHSGATEVEIRTTRTGRVLWLIIRDNGCGISDSTGNLYHLEQRARKLRARMDLQTAPGSGTTITLTLRKLLL